MITVQAMGNTITSFSAGCSVAQPGAWVHALIGTWAASLVAIVAEFEYRLQVVHSTRMPFAEYSRTQNSTLLLKFDIAVTKLCNLQRLILLCLVSKDLCKDCGAAMKNLRMMRPKRQALDSMRTPPLK